MSGDEDKSGGDGVLGDGAGLRSSSRLTGSTREGPLSACPGETCRGLVQEEPEAGSEAPQRDEPAFVAPNKGRRLQARRTGKRKLFDAKAKAVFLGWFAGTSNLCWAAKKAGVHYRTVLRHRMEDAGFREAYDAAEAQSIPRLRAWYSQAKEEEAARVREAAGGGAPGGEGEEADGEEADWEETPGGDPAPEHLTVEQAIRIVEAWDRKQARPSPGPGQSGPGSAHAERTGRTPTVASNAEVRAALVKALSAHGVRARAARAGGSGEGASS